MNASINIEVTDIDYEYKDLAAFTDNMTPES